MIHLSTCACYVIGIPHDGKRHDSLSQKEHNGSATSYTRSICRAELLQHGATRPPLARPALLAWHPSPALSHVVAFTAQSGDVIIFDCRIGSTWHTHALQALQNVTRQPSPDGQTWQALVWSPNGFKLFVAGPRGASAISYLPF